LESSGGRFYFSYLRSTIKKTTNEKVCGILDYMVVNYIGVDRGLGSGNALYHFHYFVTSADTIVADTGFGGVGGYCSLYSG
jgi:hypothetical protein